MRPAAVAGVLVMYARGAGVAQDDARAVALYGLGCDLGAAEGCFDLGERYAQGKGGAS